MVTRAAAIGDLVVGLATARATDGVPGAGEGGDEGQTRVPVTLATPLEDYGRARVAYPAEAIDALASGEVRLELDIDARGIVTRVKLQQGAGHGFDELAAGLARRYRFRPARTADGHPVASRIGWRMAFAEWRPVPGGAGVPTATSTSFALVEPATADGEAPGKGRAARDPSPPRAPQPQPRLPTREEVEARPIATLTEPEREELCRWQIRLRGGAHGHRCSADTTREGQLSNMVGGPADPNKGHWIVEGAAPWLRSPIHNAQMMGAAPDEVFEFVKDQPECVRETHAFDQCSVTVGEYASCMAALAERPCDLERIPACARIASHCE